MSNSVCHIKPAKAGLDVTGGIGATVEMRVARACIVLTVSFRFVGGVSKSLLRRVCDEALAESAKFDWDATFSRLFGQK